jgi:hypothetical protein
MQLTQRDGDKLSTVKMLMVAAVWWFAGIP